MRGWDKCWGRVRWGYVQRIWFSQEGKIWILVDFIRSFSHLSKVGPGVDTVLIKGDSSRDHKTGQRSFIENRREKQPY